MCRHLFEVEHTEWHRREIVTLGFREQAALERVLLGLLYTDEQCALEGLESSFGWGTQQRSCLRTPLQSPEALEALKEERKLSCGVSTSRLLRRRGKCT